MITVHSSSESRSNQTSGSSHFLEWVRQVPFRKAPLRSVKCVYCSIFCCLNLLLFIVAAADPSTMKGSSQPSAVISSQIVERVNKKKKKKADKVAEEFTVKCKKNKKKTVDH